MLVWAGRVVGYNASVVTSNLHETTFCCFEKINFKVYHTKQKGILDILQFPGILVPSTLLKTLLSRLSET